MNSVGLQAPRAEVVLSPREHEIIRMVAQGHPNKTIANALSISSWTVSTHLRHIFAKFGVGSRAAMSYAQSAAGPSQFPAVALNGAIVIRAVASVQAQPGSAQAR